MHSDQVEVSQELVRGLLRKQVPDWSRLPLRRVRSGGTDHALFRLGDRRLVRLPLTSTVARQRDKEHVWLPRLASGLPLRIPEPLVLGQADAVFPLPWSVYSWLPGQPAVDLQGLDLSRIARCLAEFILCLRDQDTRGGPAAGQANFGRGLPLATRDQAFRLSLARMEGQVDQVRLLRFWEACLATPAWKRAPVWVHGDLKEDNLLLVDGELAAVIDFGGLGTGDPAVDLLIAWSLFDAPARQVFRDALDVDEADWIRGQGWAISVAVMAIPYYQISNRAMVAYGWRLLNSVMAEGDSYC